MVVRTAIALTFAVGKMALLSGSTPAVFNVNEPVSIAGVPPVTLGPGTYVLRTLDSSGGTNLVQILSKQKDYVYTTVFTIPATRLKPEDKSQVLFSEAPFGNPPTLHLWFPPGESRGYEFVNPQTLPISHRSTAPAQLELASDGK